jgi:hypothetical protein
MLHILIRLCYSARTGNIQKGNSMRLIPRARHLVSVSVLAFTLLLAACAGDAGSTGPIGPAGSAGPEGPAGAGAPASAAGISLDKAAYTIASERTFTVTGWGFLPGEAVIIEFQTNAYGPGIIGAADVNAYGTFEVTQAGRFRMDRIKSSPGTYTVWATGSLGSKAAAPIVFIAGE